MSILTLTSQHQTYQLLDSGNGHRLEQFGNRRVMRPDGTCLWAPRNIAPWNAADLRCVKAEQGSGYRWQEQHAGAQPWTYSYSNASIQPLNFLLRTSEHSKNVGIFPEQAVHWDWLVKKIMAAQKPNILNLFAYTGGATLVAAAAGAQVCHVDAAKSTVAWARQNAQDNGLATAPIRWIVDDCLTFIEREIKRGKKYDGIIMDPPAFGRDPQGKPFTFEDALHPLMAGIQKLLTPEGFLLLNVYSVPFYATHIGNVVEDYFPDKTVETGELHLMAKDGRRVPCNLFVRV